MAPHQTLFQRPCFERLNNFLSVMMVPQTTFVNVMLASLRLTSEEQDRRESEDPCYERYVILSFLLPVMLILTLLYLPVFSLSFIFWAPLQKYRRPYHLNVSENVLGYNHGNCLEEGILTIVTIDTKLLPEYMARLENLSHTQKRAKKIAESVTFVTGGSSKAMGNPKTGQSAGSLPALDNGQNESSSDGLSNDSKGGIFHLQEEFPDSTDVVCFQGVYDWRAERTLVHHLSQVFPYVICDVTHNSWRTNRFRLGSGLVLASKLPVSEADFRCFEESCVPDKIKAKGYLTAKLEIVIGTKEEETQQLTIVNTELQEGCVSGSVNIRNSQLTQLQHHLAECEGVKVVCGSHHFDNLSPDEKSNWSHSYFEDVIDPCALHRGTDMPGTIGTDLKAWKIYKENISSPANMKSTLQTVEGQGRFLKMVQSTDTYGATSSTSARRTNRIIYCKDSEPTLELRRYMFVTKLAGLTTCLPLAAEFSLKGRGPTT